MAQYIPEKADYNIRVGKDGNTYLDLTLAAMQVVLETELLNTYKLESELTSHFELDGYTGAQRVTMLQERRRLIELRCRILGIITEESANG